MYVSLGMNGPLASFHLLNQSTGYPVTYIGLRSFSQWYLPVSRWRSCTLLGTPPPATCFLYSNAAFQGWSSTVCGPVWGSAVPRAPQGGSSPLPPPPHPALQTREQVGTRGSRRPGLLRVSGSPGSSPAHAALRAVCLCGQSLLDHGSPRRAGVF